MMRQNGDNGTEMNEMTKLAMEKQKYGLSRTVDASFDDAVERTVAALGAEGFGVLSEIRLDEKLKEKLGIDFRKYVILGACNPPLAYKTLQQDINIGLLLPCNVIVYEADESGQCVIAAVDANAMMSVVGESDEIKQVTEEVNERLSRVLATL
jgi:uncharacterized protein (DUF302 family)